jgi:hypothetical protein
MERIITRRLYFFFFFEYVLAPRTPPEVQSTIFRCKIFVNPFDVQIFLPLLKFYNHLLVEYAVVIFFLLLRIRHRTYILRVQQYSDYPNEPSELPLSFQQLFNSETQRI